MTIAVAYKWAANPADAVIGPDGTVDWSGAKPAISEYDPIALEIGRRLAAASGHELIGLSVGGPSAESSLARKAALARGLDRAVIVAHPSLAEAGSSLTAAILAALIAREPAIDLVIAGDSSVDQSAHLVPALVAGHLGWPALADIVAVNGQPGDLALVQAVGSARRQLRLSGPAVLALTADAAIPRLPGIKDILAAGAKPVELVELATLAIDSTGLTPTSRSAERLMPPERRRHLITAADPAAAVGELLTFLAADGVS